ncbi:MAG TPA: XRE family transcriptional regulator [Opitutaceae bacterium]|nr:XRE family transcriptional regulator [Opitutaceae bacterium]
MSRSIPALVNPPLLVWAREEAGYAVQVAADWLKVPAAVLQAWENGTEKPPLAKAQSLARFYHRPLGVFYLPHPPNIAPLAAEYRRLPDVQPGVESPELRLALRLLSWRRDVALELSETLGTQYEEFATALKLTESPAAAGSKLRALLGVTSHEQLGWRDEWQAWRAWRGAVEHAGVLVFQFPKVPLEQARGVALLRFPLPGIGINSKETAPGSRAFTLIHELVHVALAFGREEQSALTERRDAAAWAEVERFAEETASAVLVPADALEAELAELRVPQDGWDVPLVRRLATTFRITPLAMATRLRAEGALTWAGYGRWKESWQAYLDSLALRRGGFASPVDKTLGRAGRPLVRLVLTAMDANQITAVDAARYLDLGFQHFDELREALRPGPGAGAAGDDDGN